MALPPGLSEGQFASALDRMRTMVGNEWVFSSDEDILLYRDAYTPFAGEDEELIPSGAVAPASVEEVQAIVRVANDAGVPLWPISTGRNLGYGGAAPRMSGTLVLDLKRMDRVIEVDEDLAYAIVEPGVSYFDFYRYLRDNDLKVWLDCADPGWGSLVGNALDHGVGHTPHRDHFDSHCGMEVVLGSGEIMRTGMGALPDSPNWATYKYGFGPHISPIFGQSNFGIVTKMGFWLMPEQEASKNYVIGVPRNADVVPFLRILANLQNSGILQSSWQLVSPLMSSQDPEIAALRNEGADDATLEAIGVRRNAPYWQTRIRFYGPENVIDAKWEYVQGRLNEIPGATGRLGATYTFPDAYTSAVDPPDDLFATAALGIPNMSIFSFAGASRSLGHIFFSPIIPMSGTELQRAQRVFTQAFADLGMRSPGAIGGWSWYERNLVLLFPLGISDDIETNRLMRSNYRELVRIAAANGWGEYRTAPAFMDDIMASFSFNDNALLRFHETIKDAIDPNGILAPGKSGIWPRRYRGERA